MSRNFFFGFVLLLAAGTAPPNAAAQTVRQRAPAAAYGECTIRIMQDGKEITPQPRDGRATYRLAPTAFRVEVAPLACEPSIALLMPREVAYITQTPLIFGNGSHWMAGSLETADILASATGRNPRTTVEEEIEMGTNEVAWAEGEYRQLCKRLGYCPTPVKHYATAWPFADPESQKGRGFAEFKRFDGFSGMEKAAGRVLHAVVYTEWKVLRSGTGWNASRMYALQPHVLVLDFR